jgi:tripartite-type tricarboxylate transporter receptor subunit TctC
MKFLKALGLSLSIFAGVAAAGHEAHSYPDRPVRLIVPYQAGGAGLDALARLLAQKLSEQSGARFYVENIAGAGGTLGALAAARSAADGHTLLFVNQDFVIQPLVKPKVAYDPFRDFTPITMIASGTESIVVNPAVPASSIGQLIDVLRAAPGKYSYATPGFGTSPHLASERLFRMTHALDVVHVPFQGGGPAVAATLAGHTAIMHINLAVVAPYLKTDQLRALAVASKARAPSFPDIPTLDEAGIPHHEVGYWNGLVAPAGTPKDVLEDVARRVRTALALVDVKEKLSAAGLEPIAGTADDFARLMAAETAEWTKVVRTTNIGAE